VAAESPVERYVLDAYALFAYLAGEPSAPVVAGVLEAAAGSRARVAMCVVNLGEVFYRYVREHGRAAAERSLTLAERLPVEFVDADRALTLAAAGLKGRHRMSYADCFAAALAQELDATLLTGDREFEAVEDVVQIEWLAPPPSRRTRRAKGK